MGERVVVLGAGPAGLAVGADAAQARSLNCLLVDRAFTLVSTWRQTTTTGFTCTRRDRCRPCRGCPYHAPYGPLRARADVVEYLEDYAPITGSTSLGTQVRGLDATGGGWVVQTADRDAGAPTPSSRPATTTPRCCPTGRAAMASPASWCTPSPYRNADAVRRKGRARRRCRQHRRRDRRRPGRGRSAPGPARRAHRRRTSCGARSAGLPTQVAACSCGICRRRWWTGSSARCTGSRSGPR